MFLNRQTPKPPPELKPATPSNGIEISIRLSETSIAKIIQLILTILVSSGLFVTAQSVTFSGDRPSNVEVEVLNQD